MGILSKEPQPKVDKIWRNAHTRVMSKWLKLCTLCCLLITGAQSLSAAEVNRNFWGKWYWWKQGMSTLMPNFWVMPDHGVRGNLGHFYTFEYVYAKDNYMITYGIEEWRFKLDLERAVKWGYTLKGNKLIQKYSDGSSSLYGTIENDMIVTRRPMLKSFAYFIFDYGPKNGDPVHDLHIRECQVPLYHNFPYPKQSPMTYEEKQKILKYLEENNYPAHENGSCDIDVKGPDFLYITQETRSKAYWGTSYVRMKPVPPRKPLPQN